MTERGPRLEPIENESNNLQVQLHRRALIRTAIGGGLLSLIGGGAIGQGVTLEGEELKRPKAQRSEKVLGESAALIAVGVSIVVFAAATSRSGLKDAMDGLEDAARQDERKKK